MNRISIPAAENEQIIYADIQKNRYSPGYSLIVKKCAFCKMEHIHSGEQGHRAAHCFNRKTGEPLAVVGYNLLVDWKNPKNEAHREAYEAMYAQTSG